MKVVMTTINPPTEAFRMLKSMWHEVIVIGDVKTPNTEWHNTDEYYGIDRQKNKGYSITKLLPLNSYARKMVGYLIAMEDEVAWIAEIDDDTIPERDNYGFYIPNRKIAIASGAKFINTYSLFGQKGWPRGLPLRCIKINKENKPQLYLTEYNHKVAVRQALINGDSDVDAIYRLTRGKPLHFSRLRDPILIHNGCYAPFNTQDTAFHEDAFMLMYIPSTVNFRFCDILRGYIAQVIMHKFNMHLGIMAATTRQVRNPHDLMADFIDEVPMYAQVERVVEIAETVIKAIPDAPMGTYLLNIYRELVKEGIVQSGELPILEAWIYDVNKLQRQK